MFHSSETIADVWGENELDAILKKYGANILQEKNNFSLISFQAIKKSGIVYVVTTEKHFF